MANFELWDRTTIEQFAREATAKLIENKAAIEELVSACDAAETMLRCLPETNTNARGTKPSMSTTRALGIVRAALTKHESTTKKEQ